jgi:hypothetical protein
MKFSLIEEYVKKPSAHGMSTFNGSSVNCNSFWFLLLVVNCVTKFYNLSKTYTKVLNMSNI